MMNHSSAALETGGQSLEMPIPSSVTSSGNLARQAWRRFVSYFRGPVRRELASSLNLHSDYEDLAREACNHYGLSAESLRIRAATLGFAGQREIYAVLIASRTVDSSTCAYLTFLAPRMFRRVKAAAEAHWLHDYSGFAGIWTQWPMDLPAPHEINSMLRAQWDVMSSRGGEANGAD